jgi:hypothetical protein
LIDPVARTSCHFLFQLEAEEMTMPLKLSVGLSRKVGQPDYGSLGASCGVEVELDPTLLRDDLQGFHASVRDAFVACGQAVNDELSRLGSPPGGRPPVPSDADHGPQRVPTRPARRNGGGGATARQVGAIGALARRKGADLDRLLRDDFGVARPEDLSLAEASRLIDALRAAADA